MHQKTPGIFEKIKTLTHTQVDLWKAKQMFKINGLEESVYEAKALDHEPYAMNDVQGYYEKNRNVTNDILKSMSRSDSAVIMVIQTYLNKIASFAQVPEKPHDKGFEIVLKKKTEALEQMKVELFGEDTQADPSKEQLESADLDKDQEISDLEKERQAEKELDAKIKPAVEKIQDFIRTCGDKENRPFKQQKWNFDSYLRAIGRDTLTYDFIATEMVADQQGNLNYFYPIDAATVLFSSPKLKNYKNLEKNDLSGELDKKVNLELDEAKLQADLYKYVQVIRGQIRRAFLEEELCVGMRNPVTDIYANGYSISELELLINIVSSHIYAEHYNKSYFTQGFSAKGILHIKAPLNRRKLEQLRIQWRHMLKGGVNSFQTPIISGSDEVKWLPLTQNHQDIEFSNYINYLIKIICGVYQIDPSEIGFSMKAEGSSSGGSLAGDNVSEKADLSREKGLVPIMKFIANYINLNIIDKIAPEYKLRFVGLADETASEALDRYTKEKEIRPINSILREMGEREIPGADNFIMNPTFFQWFQQFSEEGKKLTQESDAQGMMQDQVGQYDEYFNETPEAEVQKSLKKGIKTSKKKKPFAVEYYKLDGNDD